MLVALLMVFVILMQRPKSEGLGAAFGGARHRKHFRRTNDQCSGQIHRLVGRDLFRSDVRLVDPLRQ
jgi:hypothetical protein